jgi:DNA polymerase III sliding clamp (beta) subunit (PCNA family)
MSIVTTTEDLSGYKLFARSLQSKHFKTIFETLKELLIDTNIQWDKDGLKIIDLDNTRVVMIHLRIHADKFEDYVCEEPITMGVNLTNLNKLMKTVDNSDTLSTWRTRYEPSRDQSGEQREAYAYGVQAEHA